MNMNHHAVAVSLAFLLIAPTLGGQSESQTYPNELAVVARKNALMNDNADLDPLAKSVEGQNVEFQTIVRLGIKDFRQARDASSVHSAVCSSSRIWRINIATPKQKRALEMTGVQILNFNIEELRQRLQKMPDEKLREFGEAARYMCSPRAMLGKPALPVYLIQLEEATAEWRRRHPKNRSLDEQERHSTL